MIKDINDLIDLALDQKDFEWTTKLNNIKTDNSILEQIDKKYRNLEIPQPIKKEKFIISDVLFWAKGFNLLNNITKELILSKVDKEHKKIILEADTIDMLLFYTDKQLAPLLEVLKVYFYRETVEFNRERVEILLSGKLVIDRYTYDNVRKQIIDIYMMEF